jgi:cold shock protein
LSKTGKIKELDPHTGHGFIEPDDGSAKVAVHADLFGGVSRELAPGTAVRFSTLQGIRGPTAYNATILAAEPPASSPTCDVRNPSSPADYRQCRKGHRRAGHIVCRRDYEDEITELLISKVPSITAAQIRDVRDSLTNDAIRRRWLE